MSTPLLYDVLFAWKCSSTHHKLALDALRHLRHERADAWRDFFLARVETYLDGSKAPDNKFKDFKNHVLHVRENQWGGAVGATIAWYAKSLDALKAKKWHDAVYNIGVMSHYFSDPWQPFHTGQSEAESIVHRAAEWSIACDYQELQAIIEHDQGGYPNIELPGGDDWLAKLVVLGAQAANPHYEACIDHYDIHKGVKDPPAGLDQDLKDRIARLIGQVVVALARVLDRLFTEADVAPPSSNVSLLGVMAKLTVPIFRITKKMKNAKDRAVVEAIYREYQQTGKVIHNLPEDEKTVRKLYAEEVLQLPLEMLDEEPPKPVGQAHGSGAPARPKTPPVAEKAKPKPKEPKPDKAAESNDPRSRLDPSLPVEKAPAIGPKTAGQLEKVGVHTVADLLAANPEALAAKLANRHFDAKVIQEWQQQARFVCEIPGLRGGDAQLLTGCGVTDSALLGRQKPDELFAQLKAFAATPAGDRILRGGKLPMKDEVAQWIESAKQPQRAAA